MPASIKMIAVSNLQSFVAAMTQKLTLSNITAHTEIYPLSLHDALPISADRHEDRIQIAAALAQDFHRDGSLPGDEDRKSTRLNSSHANISYAVFCLKKKKMIRVSNLKSLIASMT